MTQIEKLNNKMQIVVKKQSNKNLCEMLNISNDPTIRGLIFDELEERSPEAFNQWIKEDNPEKFDNPLTFFA